ncbi:MAG TPA: type II toxin-antitoxin system HicB family antitoxin [Alphaproteobacteria bacterium]|nr:type II toxin-antitoxin system HicB family antitoxin [Alphaproteobacteria bacterium]
MNHSYIALVQKSRKTYGVMFPDFPGCVSAGETFENALRNAAEALAFHVEGMREDRERIPKPRTLETIKAAREDWIEWKGAVVALVPLLPAPGKTARVQITMDERLLSRIDAVSTNRSAFLAKAALRALGSGKDGNRKHP